MATQRKGEPPELSQRAIEEIYQRLEKPMFNVVYRRLRNAEEAQDVVQEVFLRLWGHRATVRLETVEPWLYRVALNLASNRRRFARLWGWTRLEGVEADAAPNAEEQLATRQQAARLRQAIDGLPEKLRRALLLTELSGMSHPKVGRALGIPAGTVASRRHLAMRRLQELLGGEA